MINKAPDSAGKISLLEQEIAYLKQLLQSNNIPYDFSDRVGNTNTTSKCTVTDNYTLTPDEKISLFNSFFRGRTDVYALRWEDLETNRKGYYPALDFEWCRINCNHPSNKCNLCPNKKYKALT